MVATPKENRFENYFDGWPHMRVVDNIFKFKRFTREPVSVYAKAPSF